MFHWIILIFLAVALYMANKVMADGIEVLKVGVSKRHNLLVSMNC